MPTLIVTKRNGEDVVLSGSEGLSIMEVLREGGIDELLALCGGCCSCATCHVKIDPGFMSAMPEMTSDEDDLLDSSDHREANSRLSCQIPFTSELDGLRLSIAEED